jgi:hypothetical protein
MPGESIPAYKTAEADFRGAAEGKNLVHAPYCKVLEGSFAQ